MRTLGICATGLAPDPLRVFHSMLKVVEGRSLAAWRPGTMEQADVLPARFVLRLPFRVMQLLSLLDEVAAFLAAPPAAASTAGQSRWAAAA